MLTILEKIEMDNMIAILLIGVIAIIAMVTKTTDNQIVTSVVSGMIGYVAKGSKETIKR